MQVFLCEYRKIFKDSFLIEHIRWRLLSSQDSVIVVRVFTVIAILM